MLIEIDDNAINDIVTASLRNTIALAREAHYTDVVIRINGRDVGRQADWIKHMKILPQTEE